MPLLVVAAAGAVAKGVMANKAQKDAAGNAASLLANTPQVDVNKVNADVNAQSVSNAALSNKMEQQYNPALNKLRGVAGNNLIDFLNNNKAAMPGADSASPLTQLAQQNAMRDLRMGGELPQDVRNQMMRMGISQAGAMTGPGGNMGLLGRDIAARDLGLNSLQLYNQRMQNAQGLGAAADQFGLNQQQLWNQRMAQAQQATGMANSFSMPEVGLSPSSVANIYGANQNATANAQANAASIRAGGQATAMGLYGSAINGLTSAAGSYFGGK